MLFAVAERTRRRRRLRWRRSSPLTLSFSYAGENSARVVVVVVDVSFSDNTVPRAMTRLENAWTSLVPFGQRSSKECISRVCLFFCVCGWFVTPTTFSLATFTKFTKSSTSLQRNNLIKKGRKLYLVCRKLEICGAGV